MQLLFDNLNVYSLKFYILIVTYRQIKCFDVFYVIDDFPWYRSIQPFNIKSNVPRKGARLTEKIDLFILFYLMYILRFCAYSCMNNIIVYFKAEICQ